MVILEVGNVPLSLCGQLSVVFSLFCKEMPQGGNWPRLSIRSPPVEMSGVVLHVTPWGFQISPLLNDVSSLDVFGF